MDIKTGLEGEPGRPSWLAKELGKSKGAISQWKYNGVPMQLIPKVAELTGRAVTEAEMLQHALRVKTQKAAA